MRNNKLIGAMCLILPTISLVILLAGFAIFSFVSASIAGATGSDSVTLAGTIGGLVNLCVGLLGILIVIALIVGIPVGIYFLAKPAPVTGPYDKRSGKGEASTVPAEIRGWSWGGFMLTWIWGVGNSVWLSLLCFVPFVGFIMMFVLGAKGKEWAWRERQWVSVDEFKRVQKVWDIIGLVIFCLNLVWIVGMIVMMSLSGIFSMSAVGVDGLRDDITAGSWSNDSSYGMMDDFDSTWIDTAALGCTTMSGMMTGSGQYSDLIRVASPIDNETLTSPVAISGVARGTWYSEAVFPVQLLDGDGNEVASGQARASSDWMTTDFVPFTATLTYTTVPTTSCGTLVLSNDNPSGDPAKSKSVEIPVNIE